MIITYLFRFLTTHMRNYVLKVAIIAVLLGFIHCQQNTCTDVAVGEYGIDPFYVYFGLNDGGGQPAYQWQLKNGEWTSQGDYFFRSQGDNLLTDMSWWINQIPLQGGLNLTMSSDTVVDFTPTASFTCTSSSSAIWGPAYPDFSEGGTRTRGRFQSLEVFVHYSVPNETSYIRQIVHVKNTGNKPERVALWGEWLSDGYIANISPMDNDYRYYVGFPFLEGDMGWDGTFPGQDVTSIVPSVHARGPKGRDQTVQINYDMDSKNLDPNYRTVLDGGKEMAIMFITVFGLNKTQALKNAAEIDTEPVHIFHDLTADQLSMIRNWGGCDVILSPTATVTVTPPSQCSSGLTSEFTVQASSSRTDLTTGFTHRVIGPLGIEIVPAQSESKLAVPNDVGTVTHQLWYKECLVKETTFDACTRQSVPVVPQSAPVSTNTPQGKTNSASSLRLPSVLSLFSLALIPSSTKHLKLVLVIVALISVAQGQPYCSDVAFEDWDKGNNPMYVEFGLNEGDGAALYKYSFFNWWWTQADYYLYNRYGESLLQYAFLNINQLPIEGGKNISYEYPSINNIQPTANFTCTSQQSGIWGPAFPDLHQTNGKVRGSYPNLEVYLHLSIPNDTSYIRHVVFIKNIGNTAERVQLNGEWWAYDYAADVSPNDNNGRYYTGYPFPDDLVQDGPASSYKLYPFTLHVRGQKGRDQSATAVGDFSNYIVKPYYLTILPAGKEMAFMFISSFGANATQALKYAAEIDAEPPYIFHDLNADQLSMIRNWGGCQAIIGPTATVTVTPPSQCSSGLTSDFTVQASSSRNDLTADFTHQVIGPQGIVVVPPQSGTTLTVPNGLGTVTHQLWYKECLVKETTFNACAKA